MWAALIAAAAAIVVACIGAGAFSTDTQRLRRQVLAEVEMIKAVDEVDDATFLKTRLKRTVRNYAVASSGPSSAMNYLVRVILAACTVGLATTVGAVAWSSSGQMPPPLMDLAGTVIDGAIFLAVVGICLAPVAFWRLRRTVKTIDQDSGVT